MGHRQMTSIHLYVRPVQLSGGKPLQVAKAPLFARLRKLRQPNVVSQRTRCTLLCWQEPEKTDMVPSWRKVHSALAKEDDIVVPRRTLHSFQSSYPIEQFYSESYGNLYLDAMMKDAIGKNQSEGGDTVIMRLPRTDTENTLRGRCTIDWHFGPFAFRAKHLDLWNKYKGNSYDAQVVPIVHALRKGLSACSVDVDFTLDERMKEQEEENIDFIEKRLNQLNDLDPKVKQAWTDEQYC